MTRKTKGPTFPDAALIAAKLKAAADRQRAGQAHGALGAAVRAVAMDARAAAAAHTGRGDRAAEKLAGAFRTVIAALLEAGGTQYPDAAKSLAVAAIGGFGRGRLAPYSDIDLLFLRGADEAKIRPLLDFTLYPLWDAGLTLGHALHSPASAVAFARSDLVARTACLDARRIGGAAAVFTDFEKRYDQLRRSGRRAFDAGKRAEQKARHEKSERSRFLAEPDLKEGKGGLRDIQTLDWLHRSEFGAPLGDPSVKRPLLAADEMRSLRRCERRLWSVRIQLHTLRGRADEVLAFDMQPALAARLGYADRPEIPAAEQLMKDYFLNALEVGRLSRIFLARLDEERERLSPKSLRMLPGSLLKDEAGEKANLKLQGGRLHFDNAAKARRMPLDHFRLFRAYAKRPDFDLHPDALAIIADARGLVTPNVRADPAIAAIFNATLTGAKEPGATLRVMAETGLLGRYIPAFGRIVGRIEYGLYRRYSAEESVFQSLGVLSRIARGEAAAEHPIATEILAASRDRRPFFLAALMQETQRAFSGASAEAAERAIDDVARRLGLDAEAAAAVAWCAASPDRMTRVAARRNLSEIRTIMIFAEEASDRARLDLLLVLSVCRLRILGAGSWDEWTRRQLSELYFAAQAWLEGGEAAVIRRADERAAAARNAALGHLEGAARGRGALLAKLPDEAFRSFDAEGVARIAGLMSAHAKEESAAAVSLRDRSGDIEAIVIADDRTGLMADLAGAASASGASVRSVHALTTEEGKAVDVFLLQPAAASAPVTTELLQSLHARLLAAATGKAADPAPVRRIGDRRALFPVAPVVRIDLEASAECVVVEAEGGDRPGLLHDLARALADLGVTIVSAHVATYGERAVDVFYLQDAPGYKITDRRRLQSIERRLVNALSAGERRRSPLTVKP